MTTPAYALAANRRAERASARACIELNAAREKARREVEKARTVLRDSVIATGIEGFQGTAVLTAAESYAKAKAIAARLDAAPEPEPASPGKWTGGAP